MKSLLIAVLLVVRCFTYSACFLGLPWFDHTSSYSYGYHRRASYIPKKAQYGDSYGHAHHAYDTFASRPPLPKVRKRTTCTKSTHRLAHKTAADAAADCEAVISSSSQTSLTVELDATKTTTASTLATDNLLARLQSILPTNSTYRHELLEVIQHEHRTSALQHELLDQKSYIHHASSNSENYQNTSQDTDVSAAVIKAGSTIPPSLPKQTTTTTTEALPRLKDIVGNQGQRIAFATETPLLTTEQASFIQELVTEWWNVKTHSTVSTTSRYTYPRLCNQEAHLLDLCQWNDTMLHMTRDLLHTKLYPLIRHHYLRSSCKGSTANSGTTWEPRLYDSLVIRYNAPVNHTTINTSSTVSISTTTSTQHHPQEEAGLPFHRDMGLVSINIMLNSKDVSFRGGGTVFEALDGGPIVPPGGIGHALFHQSNQRHAAAITTHGTRDIWVLFVTALNVTTTATATTSTQVNTTNRTPLPAPPAQEVAARLKRKASQDPAIASDPWKRAFVLKLAIEADPTDGDAWHYLGMALHTIRKFPKETRACLSRAARLIPNDARLFHNFGTVLWSQQQEEHDEDQEQPNGPIDFLLEDRIEVCFRRALQLYQGHADHASTVFNYGSFLAHQTRWEEAIRVLSSVKECHAQDEQHDSYDLNYVWNRIMELQQICNQNALSATLNE